MMIIIIIITGNMFYAADAYGTGYTRLPEMVITC
jgi:hypothetical protein